MWAPAHVGMMGNESVGRIAKQAVKKEVMDTKYKLLKSQGKSVVWRAINKAWQQHWDQEVRGRHSIQSKVGSVRSREGNGKEESVIARMRSSQQYASYHEETSNQLL